MTQINGGVPKDGDNEWVLTEKEGPIYSIIIDRTDVKNAITAFMYKAMSDALYEAAADPEVHITVLKSRGDDFFSTGQDMFVFMKSKYINHQEGCKEGHDLYRDFMTALIDHPKVLIALVHGPAVGIAVTSLALFDAVYVSDKATFQTPFTAFHVTPEGCSTKTFPKLMGHLKSMEILALGHKITAHKAVQLNLASEVFSHWTFEEECEKRLEMWKKLPAETIFKTKELLRKFDREELHKTNVIESATLAACWETDEFSDAVHRIFGMEK